MRTTVTLDADVESLLEREMRERGVGFKQAINDAVRRALNPSPRVEYTFPAYDLGEPLVDLTHALRVADELEDFALAQKLSERR